MTSPLDWIDDELTRLKQEGLLRTLTTREGPQGAVISIGGRELINFGGNDYLGLAGDPRIKAAAGGAIEREGWGAGASPLVSGRSTLHAQLERSSRSSKGRRRRSCFPAVSRPTSGTVSALVDRGDCIFADQKNHASLIDGCRLSRAEVQVYQHSDLEDLAELFAYSPGRSSSADRHGFSVQHGRRSGAADANR